MEPASGTTKTPGPAAVLDPTGYAVCPDCGIQVHCGSVGLANLEKNHRGKKICVKTREKREKAEKTAKRPNLLTFFNRPKAVSVPSTIGRAAPVKGRKLTPVPEESPPTLQQQPSSTTPSPQPTKVAVSVTSAKPYVKDFLEEFGDLVKSLPITIPEASDYDKLAIFAVHPEEFDNPSLDADELWEEVLNGVLKSVLGWGEEGNMDDITRRGRKGLDGLTKLCGTLS